jgi:hypothetical protein
MRWRAIAPTNWSVEWSTGGTVHERIYQFIAGITVKKTCTKSIKIKRKLSVRKTNRIWTLVGNRRTLVLKSHSLTPKGRNLPPNYTKHYQVLKATRFQVLVAVQT